MNYLEDFKEKLNNFSFEEEVLFTYKLKNGFYFDIERYRDGYFLWLKNKNNDLENKIHYVIFSMFNKDLYEKKMSKENIYDFYNLVTKVLKLNCFI